MRKIVLSSLLVSMSAVAWAQDPAGPPPPAEPPAAPVPNDPSVSATVTPAGTVDLLSKEGWSTKIVDRPIALSAGMLEVDAPFVSSLAKDAVGKPFNIPLAIYYGVTNELQLSLHHLYGLCFSDNCLGDKAYNDVGLRATYSLLGRGSSFELAAWAQFHAANFDDALLNLLVGPYINWVLFDAKALILSNPGVVLGLNKRDDGNKEALAVPLYFFVQATDNLAPYLFAGLNGPFDGFGDSFTVPVGLGAFYGINNRWDVLLEFDFTNLGGKLPDGVERTDGRQIFLQVNYRPL